MEREKAKKCCESLFHAQAEWDGNKYKFQPLRWGTRSFETQYIQLNEVNPPFQWKENTAWVVRERNLTDTCGFQQKESNYTANLLFMHNFLKYGLKLCWKYLSVRLIKKLYIGMDASIFMCSESVFLLWSLPSFSVVWERSWLNENSRVFLEKKKLRVTFFYLMRQWGNTGASQCYLNWQEI